MRVFFAIEFEDTMKEQLVRVQQEVKKQCTAGNFTHKNNFHLTLRFIGEQTSAQVDKLKAALRTTAAGIKSFELEIGKLGEFPKGSKKILWIGLKQNRNLDLLYKKLEETLAVNGYEREDRAFRPHITLGREVRMDSGSISLENAGEELGNSIIRVSKISLMESKRIDNILCYVPLLQANLT